MAEIVLFHSVLGLRAGVRAAARRLEEAGHTVHIPNLYDVGKIFREYQPAQAYADSIGLENLIKRAQSLVAKLPSKIVYAGFSNGGGLAEYLALTRRGALGALLFHAALPVEMLSPLAARPIKKWPAAVPVQVHYAKKDPFRSPGWTESLAASVSQAGASYKLYEYPVDTHLFSDESQPAEYNAEAAELMWKRVFSFLKAIDAPPLKMRHALPIGGEQTRFVK